MRTALTRVFHCTHCHRVIRTTAERCKYCSATIDPPEAEAAADREDRISEATLDAERMQALLPQSNEFFFGMPLLLWLGMILAAPVFFVQWRIRCRGLPSNNPEFQASKRMMVDSLGIWTCLVLVVLLVIARSR